MNLRQALWMLAVALGAILAAGVVWVWESGKEDVYQSASVLVVDAGPSTLASAGGRPENIVFLARTYAARANAGPVIAEAIERSGLTLTEEQGRDRISVTVSSQDATITLRTTGSSPQDAGDLNQALGETLVEHVRDEQLTLRAERLTPLQQEVAELEQRLPTLPAGSARTIAEQQYQVLVQSLVEAEVEPLDRVAVLSPPTVPRSPVSPRPLRAAALAFLIAAVVGVQVVVGWRLLRRPRDLATGAWAVVPDG